MTDVATDVICPFLIDSGLSRGQAIRLTDSLDTIITQHKYPDQIGKLLGEAAVLTAMLSSTIKFDGTFTLQLQGKGPISLLAVDMTSGGQIRGYARFDEQEVIKADKEIAGGLTQTEAYFKGGTLSFNVESGDQSYQGIVALEKPTLTECVLEYFKQSEQIQTELQIAVASPAETGKGWIGSAVMLQRMPMDKRFAETMKEEDVADLWNTAVVLLHSATRKELLDEQLPLEKLLYRLFHLNDLHFFMQKLIKFCCRCSQEKVINMLKNFSEQDRQDMAVDGKINVDCQFCGKSYTLTLKDLEAGE